MAKAGKVAMFFGGAADDLDYAHKKDPANAVLKVALVPSGPTEPHDVRLQRLHRDQRQDRESRTRPTRRWLP